MKKLLTSLLILFFYLLTNSLLAQNDHSTRGFLGIYSNHLSEEKAEILNFNNQYGSYVTSIIGNTTAQKEGILPFDYIYGLNEYRTNEEDDLTDLLRKFQPGEEVVVYYNRKGQERTKRVTLGTQQDADHDNKSTNEESFLGIAQRHDKLPKALAYGVPVSIVDNSTAEAIGMENGDVILKINENPMIDWHDVSTAIDNINPGENIAVDLI